MSEIDPHPIRIWKGDKNLGEKLDSLRYYLRQSLKKYGQPENGVQALELPIDLDRDLIRNFRDLQGVLYKQQEGQQFLSVFLRYWDQFRQMFSLSEELAAGLENTDVSDVPWKEIRLPHDHFHVSWGDFGQESFEIFGFEYVVDGAYVQRVPTESILFPNDSLLLKFTCRLIWPSYKEARAARATKGFSFSEPVYDYAISGAECETVGEAIQQGEGEYREYCRLQDEQLKTAATTWGPEIEILPFGERIYPFSEKFERTIPLIRPFIPLLFNSIFYLSQRNGQRDGRFPSSAPKGQVERLRKATNEKTRKSISEALARKGYSEVVFVRDPELSESVSGFTSDRSIRCHWRRGHWRRHRIGKDLADWKWIWIKPVLVKKNESFEAGTLHRVRNDEEDPNC